MFSFTPALINGIRATLNLAWRGGNLKEGRYEEHRDEAIPEPVVLKNGWSGVE